MIVENLSPRAPVAVIHARVGGRSFGTSPGEGVVMATLRAHDDGTIQSLSSHAEREARAIASAPGFGGAITDVLIEDPVCHKLVPNMNQRSHQDISSSSKSTGKATNIMLLLIS